MKRLATVSTALTLLFILSGCGQSGPLYIPGNPSQMAVPPPQNTASTEEPEDDEDSDESPEMD